MSNTEKKSEPDLIFKAKGVSVFDYFDADDPVLLSAMPPTDPAGEADKDADPDDTEKGE